MPNWSILPPENIQSVYLFIQPPIHSFIQSPFIHLFIQPSFIHSVPHSTPHSTPHSCIHSFIQPPIQSFIDSICPSPSPMCFKVCMSFCMTIWWLSSISLGGQRGINSACTLAFKIYVVWGFE